MTSDKYVIGGHRLPQDLIDAIETGKWSTPVDQHKLQEVFLHESVDHPLLFDLESLHRENSNWSKETLDAYLGKRDEQFPPGDIDPSQSVLIGDLGPDKLIALDFRKNSSKPRVLYLVGNEEPRWVEAASDIGTLLHRLGLVERQHG
jgi:hypothetical protein